MAGSSRIWLEEVLTSCKYDSLLKKVIPMRTIMEESTSFFIAKPSEAFYLGVIRQSDLIPYSFRLENSAASRTEKTNVLTPVNTTRFKINSKLDKLKISIIKNVR